MILKDWIYDAATAKYIYRTDPKIAIAEFHVAGKTDNPDTLNAALNSICADMITKIFI